MLSGICTWITSAPQSASWRAAVGPARTCVRSMTRKRESAWDAGMCGMRRGYTGSPGEPTFLHEENPQVPHLELEHLTKRYPGVTSVDAISLAVERGEVI